MSRVLKLFTMWLQADRERAIAALARCGPKSQRLIRATAHSILWSLKLTRRAAGCLLLGLSTAYASGWVSQTQPNAPNAELCRALLYRLNHTPARCTATVIGTYPGFKSPPWKTLDASKHTDLINKLIGGAKDFVQAGGTLQIWHTRLLNYFGPDMEDPAPLGDQTIVLLTAKIGVLAIPGCPSNTTFRLRRTYVVLPDLSGPDTRVQSGVAGLLKNTYPVLYKGQTLLISDLIGPFDPKTHKPYDYAQTMLYSTGSGSYAGCWFEYYNDDHDEGVK